MMLAQKTYRANLFRSAVRNGPLTALGRPRTSIFHLQSAVPRPDFVKVEEGEKGTPSFRLFLGNKENETVQKISLWHDIPLQPGSTEEGERIFNFIVEIPRGGSDKLEMSKFDNFNPIKHDLVGDQIRKIKYHPFVWNYGFFPQTWEDPSVICPRTGHKGDGDPLDVVDVGLFSPKPGEVVHVKVIGALGLIDQGETDWKIIAINISDPKAAFIHVDLAGPEDLDIHKRGVIDTIKDFWVNYKTADGKPKNKLALEGAFLNQKEALKVIEENHQAYLKQKSKGFTELEHSQTRAQEDSTVLNSKFESIKFPK